MKKLKRRMRGIGSVILIVVLMLLLLPTTVIANPGWSYYRTITIDHNKVGADLTNFPVLVSLSGDWLKTTPTGHVGQADGGDIAFTDSGNTTKYDHEIEKYDGSAGTLVAWVRIPSLSNSTDTTLRMWYGNADCADQWNATGVWDSNHKGVWHLKETSGTEYDSSANANDGTPNNGVTQAATGKIDGANEFDGVNDYVLVGDPVPASLQIQDEITLEVWIYATQYPPIDTLGLIVGSQRDSNISGATIFLDSRLNPDYQTAPRGHIHFQQGGDGSWHQANANALVPLNQWVHIVATRKANEDAKIYYNGVSQSLTSVAWNGVISYTGAWFAMGQQKDLDRPFKGLMDEVRISNTARSTGWISTSYNNQNSPSTFHTLGSETDSGGEDPGYPIPEVSTIALVGIGAIAVGGYVWYKRRKSAVKAS